LASGSSSLRQRRKFRGRPPALKGEGELEEGQGVFGSRVSVLENLCLKAPYFGVLFSEPQHSSWEKQFSHMSSPLSPSHSALTHMHLWLALWGYSLVYLGSICKITLL
jgi:hypothetical protein